jgi:hypothetical protein
MQFTCHTAVGIRCFFLCVAVNVVLVMRCGKCCGVGVRLLNGGLIHEYVEKSSITCDSNKRLTASVAN